MKSYPENRRYERYNYDCPMYLYRKDNQDQYYSARMKDYSQGGQCLLSNEEMVVGQHVYVEMKNYRQYAGGPEKYRAYNGYVAWARPDSTVYEDGAYAYQYGIEYHYPVDYS